MRLTVVQSTFRMLAIKRNPSRLLDWKYCYRKIVLCKSTERMGSRAELNLHLFPAVINSYKRVFGAYAVYYAPLNCGTSLFRSSKHLVSKHHFNYQHQNNISAPNCQLSRAWSKTVTSSTGLPKVWLMIRFIATERSLLLTLLNGTRE